MIKHKWQDYVSCSRGQEFFLFFGDDEVFYFLGFC